jgi:ABC-2 type transport system ATP-binding protein
MDEITFTRVTKNYGPAVRAVDALDLTIGTGQAVALLGPNGAGKSTTINMLLGLTRPSDGEIRVFGDTPNAAVAQGRIGAMLQDGQPVPGLTAREIVGFVRSLYPEPPPLGEVLEIANLTDLAGRRADRLSGGQAQRVRFAMAIAGAPRLLVLDEPTTAMDVEARRAFWTSMRSYAAGGRTILFATHYLTEADENADRIVVIDHGRIAADGTAAEIKARAGGRTVRFTLDGQPAAGLDGLPGVTGVQINGESAVLYTDESDATVDALYRATALRITGLEVTGAGLESAFLSLTAESR